MKLDARLDLDNYSNDPTDYFGSYVFNDHVMRTRLSSETYRSLKQTIDAGQPLDSSIAGEVAAAMKQWAVEKGATHYTHWFMPMTGTTGEKHDSFVQPTPNGRIILEFSGKALIKGEPDASSFPSGGLRATAAARGYTAWDCTSPAFVKNHSLFIPTAFFSHTGEVLDKKAPLLRSVEALNRQAMRILRLFGNHHAQKVVSNIGPEQEYFIIDEADYRARPDLMYTGRTLFGAPPSKGQELSDQYYGDINQRISDFMQDVDERLWRLGVSAKTKHNEVAPSQHELAVVFGSCTMAADQNMIVMEVLKKTALEHGLVCLLHEKPFAGLSGSGKHVNWSLATDDGENLLDPGDHLVSNRQFLIFLGAVIKALDTHGDLLLMSVSSASNEHRLGSHEAPPAILSMTVGEELQALIDCIESGQPLKSMEHAKTNLGVSSISYCTVDTTDRNRTSPFAFTGNRFEFRMPGSMLNVAGPCFVLNTIVAQSLSDIADRLTDASDIDQAALDIFKQIIMKHKRIIYNGDNYADEWIQQESKKRGLLRLTSTVDAIRRMVEPKNLNVLATQNVLSHQEAVARCDVVLEQYVYIKCIEAKTALDMVKRAIVPACLTHVQSLANLQQLCELGLQYLDRDLDRMVQGINQIQTSVDALEHALQAVEAMSVDEQPKFCETTITSLLDDLRQLVDHIEAEMPKSLWPYPSYSDMLYRV